MTITLNEIYASIQGESTWAGVPCTFVRLTFCDLRCTYCDTEHAFHEGTKHSVESIVEEVRGLGIPVVEVTGGEPLLQPGTPALLRALCDAGFTVLLETSGAHDIGGCDARVHRIVDLKCPSSGECARNRWENLALLTPRDEVKCVIGTREDYEWARERVREHGLAERVRAVLFSPVFRSVPRLGHVKGHEGIDPRRIVEWILEDRLPVRFQLQMHKFIWPPEQRGV
jgi:7-carboxy-7-deazaguanine synthase